MHGVKSTLVLLVALVGLAGYIYFVDSERTPGAADEVPEVFDVSPENITVVEVRNLDGETARVERVDGRWQLIGPEQADADPAAVATVTSSLASLGIQRVVDENATDLAQYGLEPPRLEIAFGTSQDDELRRLLVGETTPTGGDLYAKTPDENRVFLISSFLETTFNKTAFDFRDKDILDFDSAAVTTMEIDRPDGTIALTRDGSSWRIAEPLAGRADYAAVEGLLTRLSSAQMLQIVASEAENLEEYGLARPAHTVTLSGDDSTATLLIGGSGPEGRYAKDAARPVVFTIEEGLITDIERDLAEYRRSDLFDARSFTADRLEIRRGGETIVLEKTTTEGEDAWRSGAGAAVETQAVEDLLTKLGLMRATEFVDAAPQALAAPAIQVTIRFEEDRTETVSLAREGDAAYGSRPDEPGAARIDASAYEEVATAIDGLMP